MQSDICRLLKEKKSFLLTSHVNPEGDAVCSTAALALLLEAMGKTVRIICQDPLPRDLQFLSVPWELYQPSMQVSYDCGIIVDAPLLNRAGTVASLFPDRDRLIAIDHHISHVPFAQVTWVDPQASSCGEMIYMLFKECGVAISQEAARLLYISISTDTGSFKYSNTSARTHRIVAELMETGINCAEINEQLYSSLPLSKVRVMQMVLNNTQFIENNTIGYVTIRQSDLRACGATHQDLEGVIDLIRVVDSVEIACVITESKEPGKVKASFRAKGTHDVNRVAGVFGGGGHKKAAGCTIAGTLDEVLPRVLQAMKEAL